METCAVALSGLREVVSHDPKGATFWLLPTLMDISAARANSKDPNSWTGSALFNNALTPALLTFSALLPQLGEMGEARFFDTFQETLAQRPFYQTIFSDPELSKEQKQVIFRLARYFSWETDSREVEPLVSAFKDLDENEQKQLRDYFMVSGMSSDDSKIVVTYLPYLFTQLYAKHFPLKEALSRSLESICGLLGVVKDSKDNTHGHGMRVYAGQNLWFTDLRELGKEKLEAGPLSFKVVSHESGTPEVRLKG
jgi:hypothetical protein